jgi:trimeric autotransporter adhesin
MRILGTVASSSREVPNAPTIGTATDVGTGRAYTPQNGGATVTFTAPTWTGGLPILDYTATSSPSGFTGTASGSPITVNGLAPSTSYTFTVTARNSVGSSAASAASNSMTATTVPAAPTIGTATAGNASASVAFTANQTGGKVITSYTATSSPGGFTASGASSPLTVSGLTNGTAYTFTVTASNANGTSGASSPSNSVTPRCWRRRCNKFSWIKRWFWRRLRQ